MSAQFRPAPFPTMDGSQPCRRNPEAWTPEQTAGEAARKAAAICRAACPFLDACQAYGLTNPVSGVLGGLTAPDRQARRRELGIRLIDDPLELYSEQRERHRRKTHCKRGHERNEVNGYRHKTKGTYECRPCRREREAENVAARLSAGKSRRQGKPRPSRSRARQHLSLVVSA